MGNFICDICSQNEEKNDDDIGYKDEKFLNVRNSIINDLKLSMNNSSGTVTAFQFLENNYFKKNPLEEYEIIKKLTPTKCQVIKKQDKGMKLFEKLLIMESFEHYSKNIKRIMNDIFKLNNKGIVKVNCIYKYSSKLFIIYDNIENNLLKEEKLDISIKYRKEIIENLFNIIKNIHDNNIYNIGLNLDNIILQKKTKKKILKKKSNKSKNLNESKNDNITYSISVLIINILELNYSPKSIQFYSPEIIQQIFKNKIYIKNIYTENKNDEWSCGIFLYYLITGEFPFKENDIYNLNLDLSSNKFNNSNEQEKDLLLKLLEKDEKKRISIQECLEHPFIKENLEEINTEEKGDNIDNIVEEFKIIKKEEKEDKKEIEDELKEDNKEKINEEKEKKEEEIKKEEKDDIKEKDEEKKEENENDEEKSEIKEIKEKDINNDKDINENIENDITEKEDIDYDLLKKLLCIKKPDNKLQEMALAYLSYHFINDEEKLKINNLFNLIDTDKDNKIEEEDIIYAFNKNKIEFTTEQIKQILNVFNYDPNLGINNQDFVRYLCNKEELFNEENLKKLFDDIDINKNGNINDKDIFDFITDESMINIVFEKNFLEESGIKNNDIITYEEFSNLILNKKN